MKRPHALWGAAPLAVVLFLATHLAVMSSGPNARIADDFRPDLPSGTGPGDSAFATAYRRIPSPIPPAGRSMDRPYGDTVE
jgi:hypothetical protein